MVIKLEYYIKSPQRISKELKILIDQTKEYLVTGKSTQKSVPTLYKKDG